MTVTAQAHESGVTSYSGGEVSNSSTTNNKAVRERYKHTTRTVSLTAAALSQHMLTTGCSLMMLMLVLVFLLQQRAQWPTVFVCSLTLRLLIACPLWYLHTTLSHTCWFVFLH